MRATIDMSALPTSFDCLLTFPPSSLGLLERFEPEGGGLVVFDVGEELGRDELVLSAICFVPKTCLSGCQHDTRIPLFFTRHMS